MKSVIILFLFFVFLALLLSVSFLVKKKGNRFANRILAVYTFLFAFEMLNNCLRWSGWLYTEEFIQIDLTHLPLWLIYGPLVYIYVRTILKGTRFKVFDLLFLVPMLVIIGMLSPYYFHSATDKLQIVQDGLTWNYATFSSYTTWLIITLMFFYAAFTYYKFGHNRRLGFRENRWLQWFVGSYHGSRQPDQFAIDFAMPIGTPITAAREGKVVHIEESEYDFRFPNNLVVVQHSDKSYAQYMHLTRNGAKVKVGQIVKKGQEIGLSDSTGLTGYPHLHFVITASGK